MIEDAFQEIVRLWTPIFDEFDACGVRFALEVHPTEIAFDFYTAERLLESFRHRPTLGFNFDPSHLQKSKRSEEHTSELQSRENLVCRLLLEKKKKNKT